jgi:hypothetical protein
VAQQLSLFDSAPVAPPSPPGRVLVARGARAAEALLLERLGALAEETRRNPRLLALPVRVVVPSRSLRAHLGAAVVRARGRSVAGLLIQTLDGLLLEILERAGETAPPGEPLFGVLAQRLAREEPSLRQGLGELVDGYGAVVGTVRDLLDAGFVPELAEAVDDALREDGPAAGSRAEVERARALARVAARTEHLARHVGLGRRSTLLRRAAELVEADPARALPSRAVLVHGFGDAIGLVTDFLQALLARRGAWLFLDRPPEPSGEGVEKAFTERFAERLSLAARVEPAEPREIPGDPEILSFEAVGCEAEAREAVRRVRDLLDAGARPEGIGFVARDLGPYRLPLRRHFLRLGVPFSGVGERGSLEPAGRRARAFLELLARREETPSDRWLDALPVSSEGDRRHLVDLRLAFFSLGAARLRDVAGLPVDTVLGEQDSYPLPIRQGFRTTGGDAADEADETEGEGREARTYASRRRVAGARIRNAVLEADRLLRRLASWPEEAPSKDHLHRLRRLLTANLGWRREDEAALPVFAALEELDRQVPADFPLNRDELRLLLERGLDDAGRGDLGGRGGGVQVLSVIEARARTFDHLFVLGLTRDVFPRTVREDPLLPDDLRRVLQRVLADVPIKRAGFDEERYLFAQLLSASPAVTLSWQVGDDDGKPVSPSPLVERLRGRMEIAKAPPLYALPASGPLPGPRPADEHAILAALHTPRRWFGRVLPLALAEVRAGLDPGGPTPSELAASRLAVLEELDPDLRTPEGRAVRARLGPYLGFIGRSDVGDGRVDPRDRPLYVTHLEDLAACPWQLFLRRLLRVEPTPDPLGALPGIDPPLLGNVVHGALDRIARGSLLRKAPAHWPPAAEVETVLHSEAERLLAEEGIFLPGLARALAERARPYLETARDTDWSVGALPVEATEKEGEVQVLMGGCQARTVLFKADRLDRDRDLVAWTDYKTGKPLSTAKTEEFRRKHFLTRVKEGRALQAAAYVQGTDGEAVGRYLFLRPGLPKDAEREFAVTSRDRDLLEAFAAAARALLAVWDAGAFFPRLVDTSGRNEPPRCLFCNVAEACVRGDSGARHRLFDWTERAREAAPGDPEFPGEEEAALLRVWRLPAKEENGGEGTA